MYHCRESNALTGRLPIMGNTTVDAEVEQVGVCESGSGSKAPVAKRPVLYLVIPCYNEEEALPLTAPVFRDTMLSLIDAGKIDRSSRIMLVNDGSKDNTWNIIEKLSASSENNGLFTGISFAHNKGHQNALLAGLTESLERGCDCTVSMDADLQDDPGIISEMLDKYAEGCEVVYAARSSRATDTAFKRGTAHMFYDVMGKLGVELVPDSADYRLIGRAALASLCSYTEENLFLRGLVPSIGYDSDVVYYERGDRAAGESKYPLKKMVAFAVEGITSFSIKPIQWVTYLGIVCLLVSLAMLVWVLVSFASGDTVPGWSSLMISVWFIGGCLMTSLGIVGEYVGKTYMEAKRRPRWIISKRLD